MANKGKKSSVAQNNEKTWAEKVQDNKSPVKEGKNSKVPGVFGDSDPIGGGG